MLGIQNGGFLGAEAKEIGIEFVIALKTRGGRHIVGIAENRGAFTGFQQARLVQHLDGFNAVTQIAPERRSGLGARQADGQSDDGDVTGVGVGACLALVFVSQLSLHLLRVLRINPEPKPAAP